MLVVTNSSGGFDDPHKFQAPVGHDSAQMPVCAPSLISGVNLPTSHFQYRTSNARAVFLVKGPSSGLADEIEVHTRGLHANESKVGFRIDQIPPALRRELSYDALRKVEPDALESRIAELINPDGSRPAVPRQRALTPSSKYEFFRDNRISASITHSHGDSFVEWAVDRITRHQNLVVRSEDVDGNGRLEWSKMSCNVSRVGRRTSQWEFRPVPAPAVGYRWASRVDNEDNREHQNFALCAMYAEALFGRFGMSAVRFLELPFERQMGVIRSIPLDDILSPELSMAVEDLFPRWKSGKGHPVRANPPIEVNPEVKLKPPASACARSAILESGAVVEQFRSRPFAVVITSSSTGLAPGVKIGKAGWVPPGFGLLTSWQASHAFTELTSGDRQRVYTELTKLFINGFRFERLGAFQSPLIDAALNRAEEHKLEVVPLTTRGMAVQAAQEALNGREILKIINQNAAWPALAELRVTVTEHGEGFISFDMVPASKDTIFAQHPSARMDFLIPRFPDDDKLKKVSSYVAGIVDAFAEAPARAIEELVHNLDVLRFNDIKLDICDYAERVWFSYSGEPSVESGPVLYNSMNTLLHIYSMGLGSLKGVELDKLANVFDSPERDEDGYFTFHIRHPKKGIEFEISLGEHGIEGVQMNFRDPEQKWGRYQKTPKIVIEPESDMISQAERIMRFLATQEADVKRGPQGLVGQEHLLKLSS